MPDLLMPGATPMIRRQNRNMLGGEDRATHHITWDALRSGGERIITLEGVSRLPTRRRLRTPRRHRPPDRRGVVDDLDGEVGR